MVKLQFFFSLKCQEFPILQGLVAGAYVEMDTDGEANGLEYECLLFGMLLQLSNTLWALLVLLSVIHKMILLVCFSDMDDTLYPLSLGLNLACRKNIEGETTIAMQIFCNTD